MSAYTLIINGTKDLWKDGKGPSLVAISVGWGLLLGTRMIYPILLPYFRSSFDLSLTVAGFLVTILWLGSAVGQLPSGLLADKYSERTLLAISVVLVAIALIFVITAPTAFILFVATALVGLGQSLYPVARITMLSDIYSDRLGSALGITMATGDLGQTVLPPVAGVLAVAIAWQAGLGFMIPLLLLVGVNIWTSIPVKTTKKTPIKSSVNETIKHVISEIRQKRTIFIMFILLLYIFIWQSFTGLYPIYLVEQKGLSSTMAGVLFSLFFAIGIVIKPLAGAAYDRIGMRISLLAVLVGPVIGFLLLPSTHELWKLTILTMLVSSMLGSGAITQSYLANSFSESIQGTGLGVIRTITATLGAMGPVVFGAIAERGYFNEGYIVLGCAMIVIMILTVWVPEGKTA